MNLLEAINDSIVEDSLIEDLYYECLSLEEALSRHEIVYSTARDYLSYIIESENIPIDLVADILEGGPFSRVSIASRLFE